MPSNSPPSGSPRASPFSIQEFSDLVCTAFNLSSDEPSHLPPPLSLKPPCFDSDTDDDQPPPRPPNAYKSASLPSSNPSRSRPRSSTLTALNVFKQVRTRASAFVLGQPAPPVATSARPSMSSQRTIIPPSFSQPSSSAHHPTSTLPLAAVNLNLELSRSRSRTSSLHVPFFRASKQNSRPVPPVPMRPARSRVSNCSKADSAFSVAGSLPSFFDDTVYQDTRARAPDMRPTVNPLVRISTDANASTAVRQGESLLSFFEDSGYQAARPPAPAYSRPSTPRSTLPRIHTRLPPLRKSKSSAPGLFSKTHRQAEGWDPLYAEHKEFDSRGGRDQRSPSPFTCPRDPPPAPKGSVRMNEDFPVPPPCVFERRGSATSLTSIRSIASFSSRISSVINLPGKLRAQSRSKMSLNIVTSSVNSSPSSNTDSTRSPVTPVSPVLDYTFPAARPSFSESREDAIAIGRVLTPEDDPFAKADIEVCDATPRAPTPPTSASRRGSRQEELFNLRMSTNAGFSPLRRARSSMPESYVSPAYTFPSSCSVYEEVSPDPSYEFPAPPSAAPTPTPEKSAPPSAWSPYSSPAQSSPSSVCSSLLSSSSSSSASSCGSNVLMLSTSLSSAFPYPPPRPPPLFPPPRLPPPERALPGLPPPSPGATNDMGPPVPPKMSFGSPRTRRSLPPSPKSPSHSRFSWDPYSSSPERRIAVIERSPRQMTDERPPSPFPLVRGLSDGSPASRRFNRRAGMDYGGSRDIPMFSNPWTGEHGLSARVRNIPAADEVEGWHDAEPIAMSDRDYEAGTPCGFVTSGTPKLKDRGSVDSTLTVTASPSTECGSSFSTLAESFGPELEASWYGRKGSADSTGSSGSAPLIITRAEDRPKCVPSLSVDTLVPHKYAEEDDEWDQYTTSTVFYSARSSIRSSLSDRAPSAFHVDAVSPARPHSARA
ncbi:hypothetical protein A0H81_00289 [Grifola frondosa]|uniref:Uncharacterized protein n=1 Tax=Grifola frondosa TaxID=5627 RepID=A0A1C7MVL3_GRIFR|nr:hypothetical protein A0H81_00289 [Grifola frondosa]